MDIEAYINPYNDINPEKIYLQKPTDCPYCGKGIEPIELTSHYVSQIDEVVEILFCNKCQKVFVAKYNDASKFEGIPLNYNEVLPKINDIEQIDKIVQEKFPTFCEIYKQAVRADKLELNLIVGPGYRKALEFLLKDYCISFNEDEKEKIIGMTINQVINHYITSDRIKELAKVSNWLGNDEVHYKRKFNDKDISDLKRFIEATVAFINYDLVSREAKEITESANTKASKNNNNSTKS